MNRPTVHLPDVNVLVAAHLADHQHHVVAHSWLRDTDAFATCALTETGMVRILAQPSVNPQGSTARALADLARLRLLPGIHKGRALVRQTVVGNPRADTRTARLVRGGPFMPLRRRRQRLALNLRTATA